MEQGEIRNRIGGLKNVCNKSEKRTFCRVVNTIYPFNLDGFVLIG